MITATTKRPPAQMTMARPAREQFEAVNAFLSMLEGVFENHVLPDGSSCANEDDVLDFIQDEWPKVSHCWQRVLFAGQVAIDNACDPTESTLTFKPEIATAIADHPRLTAALHAVQKHPDFAYTVTPRVSPINMADHGFEPNPEADRPGSPDQCWRRRLPVENHPP